MKQKQKKPAGTIVLYIVAVVVALIGIASLTNSILLFKNVFSQYVTQGYPAAEVLKQLVPSQLLPGIFEPVGIYGGIAVLLFAAGMINQKVSKTCADVTEVVIENIEASGEVCEAEENSL